MGYSLKKFEYESSHYNNGESYRVSIMRIRKNVHDIRRSYVVVVEIHYHLVILFKNIFCVTCSTLLASLVTSSYECALQQSISLHNCLPGYQ
jgi:hypothetical protein